MKKLHYFVGQKKSPFHLSVGAIVMNGKTEIYCHHLLNVRGKMDAYLLMRETVEPNETLENALRRGLGQEFGMKAKIVGYLGSVTSSFKNWQGANIQKTTLYFLCKPIGMPKIVKHMESHYGERSVREWENASFLIRQMKRQARVLKRSDFDESEIVARAVKK